jgi:hypothetical protein
MVNESDIDFRLTFSHSRIHPILYHVVAIIDVASYGPVQINSGPLTIQNWPNTQIINSAQFVRHLYTLPGADPREILKMLATLPHVDNLVIWGVTPISREILEGPPTSQAFSLSRI